MEFLIADTFQASLDKLTNAEQKIIKTSAYDLQINPISPGLSMHRIDKSKDTRFWSARASQDLRIIIHRTDASLLLCYVGHHDQAYAWAEKRKIEQHPRTGAAQLVEVRERIEEITIYQPIAAPEPPLFARISSGQLLDYGVPEEWLADVQSITESGLFNLLEHLPQEAAEALLELATGGTPVRPLPQSAPENPFEHPDAQRRFRVLHNIEELERAMEYPWEQWTVFLHPAQRQLVERATSGPTRIAGSAGTGKTVVALHRAVKLAQRSPQTRVLLATFSRALANALHLKLTRLVGADSELRNRIAVHSMREFAHDLYAEQLGPPQLIDAAELDAMIDASAAAHPAPGISPALLRSEWHAVIDAWQLGSWEAYLDVPRLGRKTRLGEKQRSAIWAILEPVQRQLDARDLLTWPRLYQRLTAALHTSDQRPFDHAVIDEAQDLDIPELRFLAAFGADAPERLFFTGDLGQRIFQQPFSWKQLGVDIRGRGQTLTINYRTSHQIRQRADRLLPRSISDVDGNSESRQGAISIFNGRPPEIALVADSADEAALAGSWIRERLAAGIAPEEIGVIVRSTAELGRAEAAIGAAGAQAALIDDHSHPAAGHIAISTMHLAKGLEFRAVAVVACDEDVLPLQERIEAIADAADLDDVYTTERHLLYVACTRARDELLVTGIAPGSEFLSDLNPAI